MNTKVSYSEKLRSPMWQRKRLQILQRDKFTCQLCQDQETELQIHHKEYRKGCEPWQYEDNNFITLCKHCHGFISELDLLPTSILKRKTSSPDEFAFIAISDQGVSIKAFDNMVHLSHSSLKDIVQMIINYWLLTEQDEKLTDCKFYKS